MKKRIICVILFILVLSSVFITPVSAYELTGVDIHAESVLVINDDTGDIIYSLNPDKKVYPAAIAKIMTAVVILDNISDMDTVITMTDSAYNEILGTDSAVMGLAIGEELTLKDALASILIASGGDVIYAVAEKICGNSRKFVELMNKKAEEIGLASTHYGNPVGLHDATTYTTANDVYTLTKYAVGKYPYIKELLGIPKYTVGETNKSKSRLLVTTNSLINPTTDNFYKYTVYGKTGYTDEAGRCLVSNASYEGYSYTCVLMSEPVSNTRYDFIDTKNIYRFIFKNFEYKAVLDISNPVCEIPVKLSFTTDSMPLYPANQVSAILPKAADSSTVRIVPRLTKNAAYAPIARGDIYGVADVYYAEQLIGSVDMIAGTDVKSNLLLVVFDFFAGVFSKTVITVIAVLFVAGGILFGIICLLMNRKNNNRKNGIKYMPYSEEKERKKAEKARRKLERAKEDEEDEYEYRPNVSKPDPDSDDYFNP